MKKILSVLFRKAYVGLKSISYNTFLAGLVISSVASQSEGPGFKFHVNLLKKDSFILQSSKSVGNHFIRM